MVSAMAGVQSNHHALDRKMAPKGDAGPKMAGDFLGHLLMESDCMSPPDAGVQSAADKESPSDDDQAVSVWGGSHSEPLPQDVIFGASGEVSGLTPKALTDLPAWGVPSAVESIQSDALGIGETHETGGAPLSRQSSEPFRALGKIEKAIQSTGSRVASESAWRPTVDSPLTPAAGASQPASVSVLTSAIPGGLSERGARREPVDVAKGHRLGDWASLNWVSTTALDAFVDGKELTSPHALREQKVDAPAVNLGGAIVSEPVKETIPSGGQDTSAPAQTATTQGPDVQALPAAAHMQVAEIHVGQPSDGELRIRVSMSNDQASLEFQTDQLQLRQSLEQSMPVLADRLLAQGLSLGAVAISAHAESQAQHKGSFNSHRQVSGQPAEREALRPSRSEARVLQPMARGILDLFV